MAERSSTRRPWPPQAARVLAAVPLFLAPRLRPWHVRWGASDTEIAAVIARYDWSRPPAALLSMLLMEVGDFAMLRTMLLGVKRRADRLAMQDWASAVLPS